MTDTALPVLSASGVLADALTQGAGGLNAVGSQDLLAALDLDASPGEKWLGRGVWPYTSIGGETLAWSQRILWGPSLLTGGIFDSRSPVFSQNIVWGSLGADVVLGTVSGQKIVWAP